MRVNEILSFVSFCDVFLFAVRAQEWDLAMPIFL